MFLFQSPLHWGIAFNGTLGWSKARRQQFQSPLHWGIAFNCPDATARGQGRYQFQSPLHWGIAFNFRPGSIAERLRGRFSPLFIGESRSTYGVTLTPCRWLAVSVPSSLGNRVQLLPKLFGVLHNGCFSPLFIGESRSTLN